MLTDRFSEALQLAERLHREQTRKGNDIPYVAHLLAVAATVLEYGADEDTAIAALLHDAVEDQGGEATAELIRTRFGDRVAGLVLHCSDSVADRGASKAPWRERKESYISRLATADADFALIAAADKLHNLTATIRDVRAEGRQSLQRFAEPDRVLWYFRRVADALEPHRAAVPLAELKARVDELTDLLSDAA
jgi:(p)ppGpp synthase/HD superfamily hydrolase